MVYPKLENTPIKEIVFSISYEEIVDKDCFKNFINLENISKRFSGNKSVILEIKIKTGVNQDDSSMYHLKNENEVLQLRKGSFSYHFLNSYQEYTSVLNTLMEFWEDFKKQIKQNLTITSISVRYINVLNIDADNPPSRLVQLYPKYSSDRDIINFQNSVQFSYNGLSEYVINVVSAKPKKDIILLDITVHNRPDTKLLEEQSLEKLFKPLQEIKNRAFFDSITAKALIKYIK